MQNVHDPTAFIRGKSNSIGTGFSPEKHFSELPGLREHPPTFRRSFQTMNLLGEIVKPIESSLGSIGPNEFVDGLRVAQRAFGKPNEVWHVCCGTIPGIPARGARA